MSGPISAAVYPHGKSDTLRALEEAAGCTEACSWEVKHQILPMGWLLRHGQDVTVILEGIDRADPLDGQGVRDWLSTLHPK